MDKDIKPYDITMEKTVESVEQAMGKIPAFYESVIDSITWMTAAQMAWIFVALAIAWVLTRIARKSFIKTMQAQELKDRRWFLRPFVTLRRSILPTIAAILCFGYVMTAELLGGPHALMDIVVSLIVAWLFISFLTSFIESRRLYRAVTLVLWIAVAMRILGVWTPTIEFIDGFQYSFGDRSISLLTVCTGILYITFFMWAANALSRTGERFIRQTDDFTPSVKVLLSKLLKIALFAIAALMGLSAIGLDLTTLTIFSGAAGLGLGFGLQKVFSNYISGIILLLDRSIKPGDVIAIDQLGEYGWVRALGSRYVSLITRDGKEHLIPNELLITDKVENWSHSDNNIRLHLPVGISYDSDVHKALELMAEAVSEEPRIITPPQPVMLLKEFGESSVNLEARCWIRDPVNGISNVKSQIYLRIWDKFKEHDIKIPFPQHDLHLRSIEDSVLKALGKNDK